MKLSTLAKQLEFKEEIEYFDYLMNSFYNGQREQASNLFSKLDKKDKKTFFEYMRGCFDFPHSKDVYIFFEDLLLS